MKSKIKFMSKNTLKYLTIVVLIANVMSCNTTMEEKKTETKSFTELEKANWLIGTWENKSEEGSATEIWEKDNDSTFSGKSYFIIGKDTVGSETISLEQRGDEFFYIPTVKDQNDGKAVKFKLTSSSTKQLIFENPKHDFPQKITYTQITADSLLAEISGMIDGKQNAQQFPMKKAK